MLEVLRKQPRDIVLSAFARMAEQAPFYIYTAFVFTYGITALGVTRELLLAAVLAASVVEFVTIPLFGHVSDLIGRRRMYMIGAAAVGMFGFVYFAMVDSRNPVWIFVAIVLSLVPHSMMYGPQAALIAESFTGRLRYSGASMGYQLASVIAGGPAPLIATALFAYYHSGYAIAAYVLVCGAERGRRVEARRLYEQGYFAGIRRRSGIGRSRARAAGHLTNGPAQAGADACSRDPIASRARDGRCLRAHRNAFGGPAHRAVRHGCDDEARYACRDVRDPARAVRQARFTWTAIEEAAGRRDRRRRAAARPASPDYRSLTFTRGCHSASAPCVPFR